MKYTFVIRRDLIRKVMNMASSIVDEAIIYIGKKGWRMELVDPAHVAMAIIELGKNDFEAYPKVKHDMEYGLVLEQELGPGLSNVLNLPTRKRKGQENVTFIFDENEDSCSLHRRTQVHNLQITDKSSLAKPKVPNLNLSQEFFIDALDMKYTLKAVEIYSDHIKFKNNDDGRLAIKARGDYSGFKEIYDARIVEGLEAAYSLTYMEMVFEHLTGEVKVELDSDMPIRVTMEKPFKATWLLAPRIEGY